MYTLKEKTFFLSFCFLVAPVKVYKKVAKFSFKLQKIFWVLVFSFMFLVLVDAMDRSLVWLFFNFFHYQKNSREIKPWCDEPTSKKLELLLGTSPLAFNGLPVMAIDFGRALFRISPSMSISRAASPPEIWPKIEWKSQKSYCYHFGNQKDYKQTAM